jgi:tripartite-type tricarboxylate transporter receptor subunit TctC
MRATLLPGSVLRRVLVTATLLLCALQASAQAWPNRPIRLIVPFPPGGGADTLARPLAERLRQRLGQSIVLENKTGAGSNIGTELVARAAPDGYTFLINTDAIAIYPLLYRNLRYDVFKELAPVAYVASSPLVVASNLEVPARNLREFAELAKREPARLNFANPGQGSPHHLGFELLARTAGFNIGQANYRGGGPALTDVLAGHAQVGVFTFGAVRPYLETGKLRPLALLSEKRSDLSPELPTAVEAGWPGVHVALRFVVMAPAGTPADIITRLSAMIADSVADPEFGRLLRQQGYEPFATNPAETGKLLHDEAARWGPLLKAADIRLE